jgi:hypothetical protein
MQIVIRKHNPNSSLGSKRYSENSGEWLVVLWADQVDNQENNDENHETDG